MSEASEGNRARLRSRLPCPIRKAFSEWPAADDFALPHPHTVRHPTGDWRSKLPENRFPALEPTRDRLGDGRHSSLLLGRHFGDRLSGGLQHP